MLFKPVFAKAGVNTDQLQQILRIKLLIDNRRPRNMFSVRKRSATGSRNSSWTITLATLLLGFGIGILLFFNKTPLSGQTYYFTFFMVIMCFTIVSDFTTVLIDARDHYILQPRPVDDRTIAVSRIAHITIYVLRLALIQGIPGIIMVGIADNSILASLLLLVQIIEATFLCILFVNLIYLAMMRSVNSQKFKDLISYFQIVFTTLIFATYYLLPRLVDMKTLKNINLLDYNWIYALPSAWIASLNEVILHAGRANVPIYIMAFTGLFVPVIGLWFVIKVLAPGFNRKLAVLATSEGSSNTATTDKKDYKSGLRDQVANWFTSDSTENAGFRITYKLASRSRDFKMKAYPSFAFVPIMFLYITLTGKGGTIAERLGHAREGHNYIILMYISIIVLSSFLVQVAQSEKYKASWIYFALPLDQPGKILSGMYKAILTLYYLPFYLMLSIITICVWGPQVINDIILAFLFSMIYGILIALFTVKDLPFSKPIVAKQSGGRAASNLLTLGIFGLLGYGHYLLIKWNLETVVWIAIIPLAIIAWVMMHYYKKQSWDNIEMADI